MLIAVYAIPRSTDFAVIVAPETTAALASVIVPVIVAVTSWACVTLLLYSSATTKIARGSPNFQEHRLFMIESSDSDREGTSRILPLK